VTVPAVPVTFVSSHALAGGSERYLMDLLAHLGPSWIRSVVVLAEGPFVHELREAGYEVEVIACSGKPRSILRAAAALRDHLRHAQPVVVHANGVKAALVSTVRRPRVPVIWLKHDFSWDGWLGSAIARRCKRVVGVSAAVVASLARRSNVDVVHTGIDLVADGEPADLGVPDGVPVIAVIGRLHPVKGHLDVVAIAPRVLEQVPDARFVFVGGEDPNDLEYAREVRRRIAHEGLDDRIILTGHRSDVPAVMRRCSIVCVPSGPDGRGAGREGFPLTVLEAMAVGAPVVAYDDGGTPEALGSCGILVPPGDKDELAAAIVRVLADGSLRERLVNCGRERVVRSLTIDHMVARMMETYSEVAGR
jgi:glycosyltransferase involved in cell wall biosynthesis